MTLRFITWNVEHGSAALIQTPNGQQIAIDLGADAGFSPLRHMKYRMGIDQLDKVIITHPHMDHIEDILNFDLLRPRILLRPRQLTADDISKGHNNVGPEAVQIYQKYLEIDAKYTSLVDSADDPDIATNNGGASIATFSPLRSPKTNLNNHSIVTVIEYQGVKILSPGDNEASILGGTARRCSIQGGHKEHSCPCRAASWSGVRVPPGSFRSHISVVDHHFGRKDGGHECYRSILHQVRRMERTEEERRLREQEMSHDSK